jgi:hypothetical protein
MNNTTRRHPRTMSEAFDQCPPKRSTVFQGPYRRKIDPHRIVGWICLVGLILVLMLGL